jgi:hypothetical protein
MDLLDYEPTLGIPCFDSVLTTRRTSKQVNVMNVSIPKRENISFL